MAQVKWQDDNTGYINGRLCHKPKYAIKEAICSYVKWLTITPKSDQLNPKPVLNTWLSTSHPKFTCFTVSRLMDKICEIIPGKITESLKKFNISDPSISNFTFLTLLDKQREWNHECPFCLEDEHMGKSCECGHKEIVIFRPCGHSVCARPCFTKLMKDKLEVKTLKTADGRTFMIPGKFETTLDCNFECPVCRQTVTKTFDMNDIIVDATFWNVDWIVDEVMVLN